MLFALTTTSVAWADDDDDDDDSDRIENNFVIEKAEWKADKLELKVEGKGSDDLKVTLVNAFDTSQVLGQDEGDDDDWKVKAKRLSPVPCRVLATQSDGQMAEMDVKNAPSDCAPKDDNSPPPANVAPTANANGPYMGTTGEAVSFTSAGSTDSDGSIASYYWDFGDGGSSSEINPSYTYAKAGAYTVRLMVTDNDGISDTDTTSVAIIDPTPANVPPTANANGPYLGETGEAVSFTSAGSNDSDGNIASYHWDFGDGNSSASANPSHAYAAPGAYNVTLTVTDNEAASGTDTTAVTINDPTPANVPPTANANGPYLGETGEAVSFTSAGSQDSDGSITSYHWDFGDGNSSASANPSHAYAAPGAYNVTLTVTDNDAATGTDTSSATITDPTPANVSPTANANGPYLGETGEAVSFSSAGSLDSDGSIASYHWDFGDGNSSASANPSHAYAAPGVYNVALTVTDNDAATGTDTTSATITDPIPANVAPIANAGPDQSVTLAISQPSIDVILDGSGSFDPDGTIASYNWTGTPDPVDIVSPTISLGEGTYLFTLVVTDDQGLTSNTDTIQIIVHPFPTTAAEAHATIDVYEGPSTCVACHDSQAVDMHGSVHYQQTGAAINLTNDVSSPDNPDGLAGERGNGAIGINTYCGSHENSPRFTCAGCHVGNGRFPKPVLPPAEPARSEELSNIDCMMCHQEIYKRFPTGEFEPLSIVAIGADGKPDPMAAPIIQTGIQGIPLVDPETLDFLFEPADEESLLAGSPLMISRHEAARTVHATTRKSCLSCHAGAGGGDGTKRGDMSSALINPDPHIDIHMDTTGNNLTCADCHDAGGHRVRGRGLDLRPNDVAERFSCESCHDRPHGDYSDQDGTARDTHASRVACQTCHIPTYAKGVPTEVSRDWENPHFSAAACNGRGGWLPEEIKAGDLIPSYTWFDGTSQVYVLGEDLSDYPTINLPDGTQAITIGQPNGWVDTSEAKIYPMKEHVSKSAVHDTSNQLISHSTFEFFRTGSFDTAVQNALEQEGRSGDSYHVAQIHTFQTINHGVESSTAGLDCGSCHTALSGGPLRMDLQNDLGYELKASLSVVCQQCHSAEKSEFSKDHSRHVRDKGYDCSWCHNFSRPERGLKMP